MYLRSLKSSWKLLWSVLLSIMLTVTLGLAASSLAKPGKGGGGGKPPKDDPPSPSNPVIVFQDGNGGIFVADEDGGNQTIVYQSSFSTWFRPPSWCSPDGTDIVFVDVVNGTLGVHVLKVVDVDLGGNRTPLVGGTPELVAETNDWFVNPKCSPVPVGPGLKIMVVYGDAVESDGSLSKYTNLYLANLDGTDGRVLLLDGLERGQDEGFMGGIGQYSPNWSPASDRIVFISTGLEGILPYDVEVVGVTWDVDGNPIIQCCESLIQGVQPDSPLKNTDYLDVRWSNIGDRLALSAFDYTIGHANIWIIPAADPANAEQVIYDTEAARVDVAWSPDDQLIYLRKLRGMCGEGSGMRVKGSALAVSNVGGASDPIDPIGDCDEVAIVRGVYSPRHPDWWRNAR